MGMANKHICIDEIRGCEGNCITINDYRVAGPKPWGSGIVVKNWVADVDNVIRALRDNDVVKVVRCKYCKHFTETKGKDSGKPCGYGKCMKPFFIQMIVDADDFCSYGERREGE